MPPKLEKRYSMAHLDVKDLEKCKKQELVNLAEKLGVSTEGTVKELAKRCAEIEIPDKEPEQQPQQGEVTVYVKHEYKSLQLNRLVKRGEVLKTTQERAALLIEKGLVKTL